MGKIIKEIDLSNLPRHIDGHQKNRIDWNNSVGEICKFKYDDIEGYVEIIAYMQNTQMITIRYKDRYDTLAMSHFRDCGIGKILKLKTNEFKIEIGTVIKDNKRDITIIDREYRKDKKGRGKKWYKYKCNNCPNEDWIEESLLLNGSGCNVCCKPSRKVLVGYNDIATTDPWMIPYLANPEDAYKYTNKSGKKIKFKCQNCKYERLLKICYVYKTKRVTCPKCCDGKSYPNKFMFNILEQLNMNFIPEYHPEWINNRYYDFYIPDKQLIIEMDGGLGHGIKDNTMNKQSKEEQLEIDNYKDLKAREHNIKVVRINCDYNQVKCRFNFIKDKIINSELYDILNLCNVNWNTCDEYANSSLIFKICDFYEVNKNHMSKLDISKLFKIDVTTLYNYIKIGEELGVCSLKSDYMKNRKSNCKCIINITTGDIFESLSECEKKSMELYGVKMVADNISKNIKNNKTYKGFKFKFISWEEYYENK